MNQSHLTQAAEMLAQARREAWRASHASYQGSLAASTAIPSKQCLSCGAYTRPDGSLPCDH